ncbi:unnamed protein product [Rodentolepis nana]|uniref:PH domain-containing protein n=1 Tax=Rodentolepis nana TaxID=102285 RepID=A0A158QJH2_RODNA|nr:unnamed protein product [Rodentolepis nana]
MSRNSDRLLSSKDTIIKEDMLYENISFPGISEGIVMLKRPHGKWSKVLCFLVMSAIFFSKRFFGYSKKNSKYLLDLTSMDVYVPQEKTDATKLLHTPTPHTLLLVPSSIGLLDPDSIFAIGCKTRESMLSWAEGLRFHKVRQSGAVDPRAFDFNTSRDENSATMPRWSTCSSEVNQSYFHIHGTLGLDVNSTGSTLENSVETRSFSPISNSGRSFLHEEMVGRSNAYEQENAFEGIVFQSGVPHLLIALPDGIHNYLIEVNNDRGFDEKRYQLPSRPERFATLSDLCSFYEKRRNLLTEDEGSNEISPLSHCPSNRDDPATAF